MIPTEQRKLVYQSLEIILDSDRKIEDTDQCKCFQTKLDLCMCKLDLCMWWQIFEKVFQTASSPSLVTIRREYIITGNAKLNQLDLINPICISPFAMVDNDKCKSSSNLCFVNAKYKVKMKYEVSLLHALHTLVFAHLQGGDCLVLAAEPLPLAAASRPADLCTALYCTVLYCTAIRPI